MFAFNFGLPQGYDEGTGTVRISSDETYSGFYAVNKIEHVFNSGKFTQIIDAYRIPGIALNDLTTGGGDVSEPGDAAENSEILDAPQNVEIWDIESPRILLQNGTYVPPLTPVPVVGSTRFNPPAIDSSLDGFNGDDDV
jgi:hypothetical protein